MAECENCGEETDDPKEICPGCGFNPGPQTVTDLPKGRLRRKKSGDDLTVPRKKRSVVCVNCRTDVPGNINLCPQCGLNPGVQTITDIEGLKGGKKEKR